ncbi:MAG: LLM class flavin-dependent oxidoreductase [Thaumarchaeota archaeon]|nr:LLM class flavin-dependent oxidoreductase [Nitrososphaerota archaeon]
MNGKRFSLNVEVGDDGADPLRQTVKLADELGFEGAWLGDHYMPWIHSGGRAGMVWPLLGVCLEATKKICVGPIVTTPIGGRYHPALVAQACATLDEIYPGRLTLAVGTGEAVNEYPFMERWPSWKERTERLVEGVRLMRQLWESDSYFDFDGRYFGKKQLFLYSKPKTRIKVNMSSFGEKSARLAGLNGDGLITTTARCSFQECRDVLFPNFDAGARESGRDPATLDKIVLLIFTFEGEDSYLKSARERAAGRLAKGSLDNADPRSVESKSESMSKEEILSRMHFCSTWSDVVELVSRYRRIGVTNVILPCGPDPEKMRDFAKEVLPHFHS